MNNVPVWEDTHSEAATAEGWDIFDCEGSENGPWQVQKIDDLEGATTASGFVVPDLMQDLVAWRLVVAGKAPHHIAARAFIQHHNRREWLAMLGAAE
jgi:hypothetical protein